MNITGTIISSGRANRMRADAAALRRMRHDDLAQVDRERQHLYAIQRLQGAVDLAERQVVEIIARCDNRAADVAGMREESAATGHLNPYLTVAVLELGEHPPMIDAARARVKVAREALAAEMARQSDLAAEQAETAEHDPVPAPQRGRGRPAKVLA